MYEKQLKNFTKNLTNKTDSGNDQKLIPAATVLLLRDGSQGIETLMLRKNSKIAFAGMWVFPGGRIDAEDGPHTEDMEQRARIAAARELTEEAALVIDPERLSWFSHWTPPALGNRRFETWFFAAQAPEGEVQIDDGEIIESQWISPEDALGKQRNGEIELAPPTYVTLHYLTRHTYTAAALAALDSQQPRYYATRIAQIGDDLVAMWRGDAGYDSGDPETPGPRHRLRMAAGDFEFDDSGVS